MSTVAVLPRIVIKVDSEVLDANTAGALGAVLVMQRLSCPSACELTFYDPTGPLADGESLLPGSSLTVSVEGRDEPLFVGEITATEFGYGPTHGRETRVRGYDLLHRLRKEQPIRHYSQVTLGDLAKDLVSGLDLHVEIPDHGPVWPKLVQWRQSNLEMLTKLSEQCGQYFCVRDNGLFFFTYEGLGESKSLAAGEDLLELKVDLNTDPACRIVETSAWDPWLADNHRGRADAPRSGRDVGATAGPEQVGSSGERTLSDETVQSDEQADCLAQAELDRRYAGEVTLWGIADGDPGLRPGTPVHVTGIAPTLSGGYVLTAVTHTIDRVNGFRSEIDTAPPVADPRPHAAVATVGVVTDVEDPEGLGRVRVSLPNYGDVDSDWFQVVVPGAGEDKGLVALPDRDDRVLVLLTRGDPAQGVVLGGLYGDTQPPDTGVKDGAIKRYTMVTPGGQRLRLDDDKKTVRLENSRRDYLRLSPGHARLQNRGGSYLELGPEKLIIHADADLVIEAPGKNVTIRGASIDFETG